MKNAAASLFASAQATDLEQDVIPLNFLSDTDVSLKLPSSAPSENRERVLDAKDEALARRDRAETDGREVTVEPKRDVEVDDPNHDLFLEVRASIKTIQILGQVLRNGVGSIKSDEKQEIVSHIFRLGRRILGYAFEHLDEEIEPWVQSIIQRLRVADPNADDATLRARANRSVFGLAWIATFNMIKHVSESVGLEMLRPSFDKALSSDPVFANRLFDLSIELDHSNNLPKKKALALNDAAKANHFGRTIVRSLVMNHLYLYDVPVSEKQSITARLSIEQSKETLDPARKKRRRPPS